MKVATLEKKLGDVVAVQSGFAFKSSEYCDSGHFLIRIANVQDGFLSLEKPKYVALDAKTKRFELQAGDILTSLTGNVGRVAKVEPEHLPAALNQRVARLVPKPEVGIDAQYLLRFLQSSEFSSFLEERAHGAAQANVSPSIISEVPIPLPPLEEQQRIVAVLDEAFDGLARARAHAEANLQNARELFAGTIASEFEKIASAPRRKIGDVAIHSLGKMLDKNKNKGTPRPYLRNINVRWFSIDTSNILEMRIGDNETEKYSVRKGDLLICEGGYPGRSSIWNREEEIFFQKALHRVRFESNAHGRLLMYFLFMADQSGALREHFSGSGIQHFTGQALAKFTMPFPPANVAEKMVAAIEAMQRSSGELENHYEQKLQDINNLRQSLLQKAFAGELT